MAFGECVYTYGPLKILKTRQRVESCLEPLVWSSYVSPSTPYSPPRSGPIVLRNAKLVGIVHGCVVLTGIFHSQSIFKRGARNEPCSLNHFWHIQVLAKNLKCKSRTCNP